MVKRFSRAGGPVGACAIVIVLLGRPNVLAQDQGRARAEANQLHAAIVNGDVAALQYWLTVRYADASAASDEAPGVTPLARCLGLAARVLDGPEKAQTDSAPAALP